MFGLHNKSIKTMIHKVGWLPHMNFTKRRVLLLIWLLFIDHFPSPDLLQTWNLTKSHKLCHFRNSKVHQKITISKFNYQFKKNQERSIKLWNRRLPPTKKIIISFNLHLEFLEVKIQIKYLILIWQLLANQHLKFKSWKKKTKD
jgi:uncharacterized protein YcgL (UPF0745 family)